MKITTASNGYILTFRHAGDEEDTTLVFQFAENSDCDRHAECKALKELLYSVLDKLGPSYSKHEKYNVRITIEEKPNE